MLSAAVTYDPANKTITNTYDVVTAKPEVTKEVTGNTSASTYDADEEFTFTLAATDGAPMPGEGTTVTIKDGDTGVFGEITYTTTGEYKYTITETAGDTVGMSYDTEAKNVTVTVAEDETTGELKAEVKYDGEDELVVTNTFTALAERPVVEKHPAVERGKSLFLRGILGGGGRLASSGKVLDHGLEDAALAIDVVVVLRSGYERAEYDDATLPEFACRADDIVAALHEHPAERPDLQHHVVEASEHERLVPERLGDSAVAVAPEPRGVHAVVRRRDLRESLVSASPDSAAAERTKEHAAATRREPHHLPRGRAGREVSVVPAARKHDDVRALVRLRLFKDFRIALYLLQLVPCILNGSLEHG